jgi:rubrerythrin
MTQDLTPEAVAKMLKQLRRKDEYEPLGHDGWTAADMLEALAAKLAEVEAERDTLFRKAALAEEWRDHDKTRAEAAEAENARLRDALLRWQNYGCPDCGGDCASANPPVTCCIMRETAAALTQKEKTDE